MKFICAIFIALTLSITANAQPFYRHVPFMQQLKPGDSIQADYAFEKERGVRCSSLKETLQVSYTYKGRDKTSTLPVILQGTHVPESMQEELADMKGNLQIAFSHPTNTHRDIVTCEYTEPQN